jgi:hypothetical protein
MGGPSPARSPLVSLPASPEALLPHPRVTRYPEISMRFPAQALYFCHPQIGLARVACCLGLPIDFSASNA